MTTPDRCAPSTEEAPAPNPDIRPPCIPPELLARPSQDDGYRHGYRITRVLEIDREMGRIKRELTGTPEGQFLPWPGEPDPNPLPPDSERYRELTARMEALRLEQGELMRGG
jgi:hypothetical protein